ncbi:hypothetical protein KDX31_05660 [Amphritea atlantica]|uniref:RCK C-terminal domain-containing protein n=1 Tax=Amphritea atlantica TaxID=355243 RepID=A0ABY5GXY2_9GAMM|nr:hypothetical protein KDX31_05660 [Amphritea atlantica]
MAEEDLIHIWRGERLLLPDRPLGCHYRLRCLSGSGLIRVMSRSRPYRLKSAQSILIPADEVVTVSGSEDMVITLKPENKN